MPVNLKSICLDTDSYKSGMWLQYPKGTEYVYSYIESRGGMYDVAVFFGLQAYLKEYLSVPVTQEDIDYAAKVYAAHGDPFNREGWEYVLKEHGGYLPVKISAVPEGSIVPVKNVLAVIENTDPKCPWATTWVETPVLRAVWYGSTVASRSYNIKQVIAEYLEKTGDIAGIWYKLHNFGARGASSFESAGIADAAHAVNFRGSDTMSGILFADRFYNSGINVTASIPASEHSTITSWGRDNEVEAYRNMIRQFGKPDAMFACVSDSYDVFNAAENLWGGALREEVINSGAMLVVRPDSGDPEEVCVRIIKILDEKFGHTINDKGYKVLNHVRIIQGDGVNERTIRSILGHFSVLGYSADNIAFGCGGYLNQALDRDTMSFAMKCSAICVNGEWRDVQKDPITQSSKKSKAGRVTLFKDATTGEYYSGREDWNPSALVEVFNTGRILKEYTFDEVRANAKF